MLGLNRPRKKSGARFPTGQLFCASRLSHGVCEHIILCVSTTAGLPVGNRDAGVVLKNRILS